MSERASGHGRGRGRGTGRGRARATEEEQGGRGKRGQHTLTKDLDPHPIDATAVDGVWVRVADAEHGCAGAEAVEVEEVVFCLAGGVVEGGCCGGLNSVGGGVCATGGGMLVGEKGSRGFGGEEG